MQTQPVGAWSRRRAAVEAEAKAVEQAEADEILAKQQAELAEKTEAEVLAELDLPNPDRMQKGDDFSAFMKSTVPEALRNRALRKLWLSDPVLANVDMLVDYGEDFTGKGDVLGAIKTVYRVGKGMLKDEPEPAKPAINPEPISPEPEADMVEEIETKEMPEALSETPEEIIEIPAATPAPLAIVPRRRMQFEFAEPKNSRSQGSEIQ
ncbi:MAG: DUF3306 domain-containing protein [Rhodobacteraceae bacterium]|nr:DUF3306 domain-containing protein [Paracoccaceae bacterium]